MGFLKTTLLLATAIGANAGASDFSAGITMGGGSKFGSTFATEHKFADDLQMGATFNGATIDSIYAKFHETFGDILVRMNPATSKVTGTVEMKHGDARAVASFDKDHPNFITKVAVTSDKIAMGTMKVVLKPTYNAITKLLDVDVETAIKDAGVKLSTSQVEGSPSSALVTYKTDNDLKVQASMATDMAMELSCEGNVSGHKLGSKMKMKGFNSKPDFSIGWARAITPKLSSAATFDLNEAELEASANLGEYGNWKGIVTAPYSGGAKFALTTKFDM